MSEPDSKDGAVTEPVHALLEAARNAIEARFLKAGNDLSQALEGIGTFITCLNKLSSAISQDVVHATAVELQTGADVILALPERHRHRHDLLRQLASLNRSLAASIDDMRRDLVFLHGVAAYNKITSAGVAGGNLELREFAQDIEVIVERGHRELRKVETDLSAFGNTLGRAIGGGEALGVRINAIVPAIGGALRDSATAIADHRERIVKTTSTATQLAADVQQRTGRVLVALQIGDITRQRVEHAVTAVGKLEAAELSEPERTFIYGLIGGQIRATEIDFHREIAEIVRCMTALADDARQFSVLRDAAYGRSDKGEGGFLGEFGTRIEQAHALVGEIESSDHQAAETGRNAASIAQELNAGVATIQSIKAEVQNLALNATLKCKRIGESGRPLVVIAEELHTQGAHLGSVAGDAVEAVEKLSQAAGPLSKAGADTSTDAAAALSQAAARIQEAGTGVQAELESLIEKGDDVVRSLEVSLANLEFENEIGQVLAQCAAELEALGEAAAEFEPSQALRDLLADLGRLYTMASERTLHQEYAASLGEPDEPVAQADAA
jgi:methyl-accepting chemotaxis protein